MKRRLTVGIAIIILAVGAAASWTAVQRLRAQAPDGVLEASGRIEGDEVLVSSKIGGRVRELLVKEGDPVRRGQLVVLLSVEEIDAQTRQAGAQVDAARAQVARALGEVSVLESQYVQARTAVAVAEAQVAAQQRQAQAALNAAQAKLAQARKVSVLTRAQVPTAVDEAKAGVSAAQADLARARAVKDDAAREVVRMNALQAAGAVAAAQVDAARTQDDVAAAQVEAAGEAVRRARAALARAEAGTLEIGVREDDIRTASAQVEAARGQVALAAAGTLDIGRQREQLQAVAQQVEIARAGLIAARAQLQAAIAARDETQTAKDEASVYAPIAGVVTSRVVNTGEVVAPGTPLLVVVNLQALKLKVFVAEPDLGKVRLGTPARVSVDTFPGRVFSARVVEISQRAEFTPKDVQTKEERVKQVFAVKLAVENADGVLKPGMPADGKILWQEAASR